MVYIRDGVEIFVFNAAGRHLATMGGEGRGPGEHHPFGTNEMKIQSGHLFTYDTRLNRVNIFSLESFEPIGAININPDKWDASKTFEDLYPGFAMLDVPLYYAFGDSLFLFRYTDLQSYSKIRKQALKSGKQYSLHALPSYYHLVDWRGNIITRRLLKVNYRIKVFGRIMGGGPLPMHRHTLLDVSPNGLIYVQIAGNFW